MKNKNAWLSILLWLGLFLILLQFMTFSGRAKKEQELSYSDFKKFVAEKRIENVTVADEIIKGQLKNTDGKIVGFKTVPMNDPELIKDLQANNVANFSGRKETGWLMPLLVNWGPVLILIVFWLWMLKGMQNGGRQMMSFGRSKAKLQNANKKIKITFEDVAGCDESKEELQEIIEFLKDPAKFQRLGGKIPKGVLLYGAPGTGKTLLAKAVAGEAGVPFFSSSGSEFVEMFVGVGASRVRDLFDQGRRSAPCLLFIDEIDAVGRHRFAGIGGGHDEREQTLNQLLVEMDGFDTKEGVILIAATNRPDVLDPALMRPGRFDRQISVPSPDLKGREQILKVHSKNVKLSASVDLGIIARRTSGFVGADLANLINEAALLASRDNKQAVEMEELEEAIDRVLAGPEKKSRMISDKEKKIISYHESGHALVAKFTPSSDPVHKVSIISRGPALGYTLQLPTEDKYLVTKEELLSKLAVLMGGRAAEELIFGDITTGAQNDLAKASSMAARMVTEFGMSEKLGPVAIGRPESEVFLGRDLNQEKRHSEKTLDIIDTEVKRIIDEAKAKAIGLLKENMNKLVLLADALIEKEVLDAQEVEKILGDGVTPVLADELNSVKESTQEILGKKPQLQGELI